MKRFKKIADFVDKNIWKLVLAGYAATLIVMLIDVKINAESPSYLFESKTQWNSFFVFLFYMYSLWIIKSFSGPKK